MQEQYKAAEVKEYIDQLFAGEKMFIDQKVGETLETIDGKIKQAGAVLQRCQQAGVERVKKTVKADAEGARRTQPDG